MKKEAFVMPQTKGQGVVFGILMSVFMAYGMELYNVAAKVGGMENKVFWLALKEAAFMCVFVFVFSTLFGNRVGALSGLPPCDVGAGQSVLHHHHDLQLHRPHHVPHHELGGNGHLHWGGWTVYRQLVRHHPAELPHGAAVAVVRRGACDPMVFSEDF